MVVKDLTKTEKNPIPFGSGLKRWQRFLIWLVYMALLLAAMYPTPMWFTHW